MKKSVLHWKWLILLCHISAFAQTKPELFVLSVGVSKYQNANESIRNLKYAHKDAIDLAEALKNQSDLYDVRRVSVLTDEKATRKNIRNEFIELKKDISPNDLFVFIFSGHGLRESLVTHEFDINDRRATSLGKEELVELISELNCSYVVLLDACYSGSFTKNIELEGKNTNVESAKEDIIAHENLTRALNATDKANIIISSSTSNEISGECDECQNGYFVESILNSIEGKSVKNNKTGKIYFPDSDKDGFVYTNELDDYLKEAINIITQNKPIRQNVISKPTTGYKFPIFKLSDSDADGTADLYDECNGIKGSAKGCPDVDEDGIADKNDKCPNEKGLSTFEGCPFESAIPPQPNKSSAFAKSLVFPGWGDKDFKPKSKKIWLGVISYASLAGGFMLQSKSKTSLNLYEKSIKQTDIEANRRKALKFNNYSTVLWGLSATIWAIDLITVSSKKTSKIKPSTEGIGLNYTF